MITTGLSSRSLFCGVALFVVHVQGVADEGHWSFCVTDRMRNRKSIVLSHRPCITGSNRKSDASRDS